MEIEKNICLQADCQNCINIYLARVSKNEQQQNKYDSNRLHIPYSVDLINVINYELYEFDLNMAHLLHTMVRPIEDVRNKYKPYRAPI